MNKKNKKHIMWCLLILSCSFTLEQADSGQKNPLEPGNRPWTILGISEADKTSYAAAEKGYKKKIEEMGTNPNPQTKKQLDDALKTMFTVTHQLLPPAQKEYYKQFERYDKGISLLEEGSTAYDILDLPENAHESDVEKAYQQKMHQAHTNQEKELLESARLILSEAQNPQYNKLLNQIKEKKANTRAREKQFEKEIISTITDPVKYNYYQLLDVLPGDGDEKIKRAYEELSNITTDRQAHLKLQKAYDSLKTSAHRQAYDLKLAKGQEFMKLQDRTLELSKKMVALNKAYDEAYKDKSKSQEELLALSAQLEQTKKDYMSVRSAIESEIAKEAKTLQEQPYASEIIDYIQSASGSLPNNPLTLMSHLQHLNKLKQFATKQELVFIEQETARASDKLIAVLSGESGNQQLSQEAQEAIIEDIRGLFPEEAEQSIEQPKGAAPKSNQSFNEEQLKADALAHIRAKFKALSNVKGIETIAKEHKEKTKAMLDAQEKIKEAARLREAQRIQLAPEIERLLKAHTDYELLGVEPNKDTSQFTKELHKEWNHIKEKLSAYQTLIDDQTSSDFRKLFNTLRERFDRAHNRLSDPKNRFKYDVELARQGKINVKGRTDIRDAELRRLADEMADQIKNAGTIDINAISNINFKNIFLGKILSLIPQKDLSVFDAMVIKTPTFTQAPILEKGEDYGFAIIGSVIYNEIETQIKLVLVRQADGSMGISIAFVLPEHWNFARNYPMLAKMDDISMLSPQLIFSNFNYTDPTLGTVRQGLNFISNINLTGPFERFQKLLTDWNTYVAIKGATIILAGVIAKNPLESSFSFTLPMHIGVDFEHLYRQGKLKAPPTVFKSIMTDTIKVIIAPKDILAQLLSGTASPTKAISPFGNLGIAVTSGIILDLVSQQSPLSLGALVSIVPMPFSCRFAGELKGLWDGALGKSWLSLQDTAIEIDLDAVAQASMALVGIPAPISGFGLQGTFGFGEKNSRVNVAIAGKIAFKAPSLNEPLPVPDLILKGAINRINMISFIQLFSKMIGKEVSAAHLPAIEMNNVELSVAPTGGSIGSTVYPAGVVAKGEFKIGLLGGGLDISINNMLKSYHASGWMTGFKSHFFSLTGKTSDNPAISMSASFYSLTAQAFVDGQISIPLLGISHGVTFNLDNRGLFAQLDFDSFYNTNAQSIEITIPFSHFEDLLLRYQIKSSTIQSIKLAAQNKLELWRESITGGMQQKRKELEQEIIEKEKAIAQIAQEKIKAQEACKQKIAGFFSSKVATKEYWSDTPCADATVQNLSSLLLQTQSSVKSLRSALSKTFEIIPDTLLKSLSSIVDFATIFEITKISGHITGKDLKELKAPAVTVELSVNLFGKKNIKTLNNVQFDFKNPTQSAKSIVDALVEFLK